ncbi:MAG: CCA tRNA nucleotidyltransferase [Chloroflexia bacterium]
MAERAEERGWRVYLVGGYVRDLLLGRPNDDVDVAVEGGAIDLANALQSHAEAKIDTADRFGTAHLTLGPGLPDIDLVTARRERYLSPGALPTVEPGTIDDDLARRDFTINALSIPVISGRWPVVSDQGGRQTLTHERSEGSWPLTTESMLDPHGGLRDLQAGLIRVLHPNSFVDDPTRIPRAVKYAERLGFKIEPETFELILRAVRDGAIATVSTDRMVRELLLIMEEERAPAMLARLEDLGVLRAIHPDLGWPYDKDSPTVDIRSESTSPAQRRDAYLAILGAEYAGAGEAGATEAEALARALGLNARHVRLMRDAATLAGLWPRLGEEGLRPSQVYNLLRGLDVNTLHAFTRISALASDDVAWRNLHAYLDHYRHVKPLLDGAYLKELGVEPGPIYSRILGELREAKLDGQLPEREDEERFVGEVLNKT